MKMMDGLKLIKISLILELYSKIKFSDKAIKKL